VCHTKRLFGVSRTRARNKPSLDVGFAPVAVICSCAAKAPAADFGTRPVRDDLTDVGANGHCGELLSRQRQRRQN
jgi:hypothetical protein